MTSEELKHILHYDPDTGVWTWVHPMLMNKKPISKEAGTISVHGYRIITYRGQKFRSGRLAWLYMTGTWPANEIDHANGNSTDDRWTNLRIVSRSENALNRGLQSNNTSGARGVHWDVNKGKWTAQVKVDGANYFIGRYDFLSEAIEARDKAAIELHGSFARLNAIGATI